jgi:hypothetical protein
MKVEQETLDEFIRLYKKYFGVELSSAEAYSRFTRTMNVFRAIIYPDTVCQVDDEEGNSKIGPKYDP